MDRDLARGSRTGRCGVKINVVSQLIDDWLWFIEDLRNTYTQDGESALDMAAIAWAQSRTFAALGKHLLALSEQAGGGFEPEWFSRLQAKVDRDLSELA